MSESSSSSFGLLARYRLGLSFIVFLLIVLEWQINDGGRPHALLALQDGEHLAGLLALHHLHAWRMVKSKSRAHYRHEEKLP